jgi:hypothetical protein
MKLLTIFGCFLFASFGLQAGDRLANRLTALYSSGEYWGSKVAETALFISDGDFFVKKSYHGDGVEFSFRGLDENNQWKYEFGAPNRGKLCVGIYTNTRRCAFSDNSPGFDIVHGSTSSNPDAEFEILELEYGEKNEIVAFAVNFATKGNSPHFGCLRFNSLVPVAKRFRKHSETKVEPSVIHFFKRNPVTGEIGQPVLLTDTSSTLRIERLPYGDEGIRVIVQNPIEKWLFDFAAPIGSPLSKKRYETSSRYPFHGYDEAGLGIAKSRSCAAMVQGWFDVLDLTKNKKGEITKLTMNFSIETENQELYEGTIYHSIPVIDQEPEEDKESEMISDDDEGLTFRDEDED